MLSICLCGSAKVPYSCVVEGGQWSVADLLVTFREPERLVVLDRLGVRMVGYRLDEEMSYDSMHDVGP